MSCKGQDIDLIKSDPRQFPYESLAPGKPIFGGGDARRSYLVLPQPPLHDKQI